MPTLDNMVDHFHSYLFLKESYNFAFVVVHYDSYCVYLLYYFVEVYLILSCP